MSPARVILPLALSMSLAQLATAVAGPTEGAPRPRARDLGIPFDGEPGPLDAITDVAGITVGHTTLIDGSGPLVVGEGPVRTGVTAVLPRGPATVHDPVFAGWFALNGNGEMTGTTWVEESGLLAGPVMITNTHSVGVVRDAVIAWWVKHTGARTRRTSGRCRWWPRPGTATSTTSTASTSSRSTPSRRWTAPGAGRWRKGGSAAAPGWSATASRAASAPPRGWWRARARSIHGRRAGAGQLRPARAAPHRRGAGGPRDPRRHPLRRAARREEIGEAGSIIVVVATDAPLLPHQLKRLARRAGLGVARTGGTAMNGSGDIFIAFSTANPGAGTASGPVAVTMLPNERMDPLFAATVEATEEAIVNALVAGESMTGVDGHFVMGLPHERVREILRAHGMLREPGRP